MNDKWRIFLSKQQVASILSRGGTIPGDVEVLEFGSEGRRSIVVAAQKALDLAFGKVEP